MRGMTYVRAFDHESDLLAGNSWSDPHIRKVHVYLPPNYSDRRKDPYAVIFMLAGWSGRGAHYLTDGGAFSWSIPERLDHLIESKQMPPAIVVFPDCTTRLGASQYVNSSVNGPYMDYLCDELVEWVDRRFHTHKTRDYRGLIGHSSGGFGALATCMMRSDRFSALCSSAGDTWYEYLYTHTIPQTIATLNKAGGVGAFVDTFLGNPNPRGLLGGSATIAMLNLSMASCYMPNPNVEHIKGDLWFDLETGVILDDVFSRLLAWDPIHMIDHHVTELRNLRWIHLEAGDNDEYGLQLGHRQFASRLAGLGIDHCIEEYAGKHGGHHYRMPSRIAKMLEAIGAV
jgi:S-formylglutathione hydrolase FrmB